MTKPLTGSQRLIRAIRVVLIVLVLAVAAAVIVLIWVVAEPIHVSDPRW